MISKDQEKAIASDQMIVQIQQNPQADEAKNQNSQVQKLSPLEDTLKGQINKESDQIIKKQQLEEELRFQEEQNKQLPEFENYMKMFQNQQPQPAEQNVSIKNQTSSQQEVKLQINFTVEQQKKDLQVLELQKQSSSNQKLLQELVNMGFEVQKAELAIVLSEATQVEQALGFLTKDQDG